MREAFKRRLAQAEAQATPAPPEPAALPYAPSTPEDEARWAALEAALVAQPGPLDEAASEFLQCRQMVRSIEEARRESEANPQGIDMRAEFAREAELAKSGEEQA